MSDGGVFPEVPTARGDIGSSPVAFAQLWRWVAPGIGAVILSVAFVLGLWTASGATNSGTGAIGFGAAALALIAIAWGLKAYFDGSAFSLLVETSEALVLLAGLLSALAIAGLALAARSADFAARSAGYALFVASVALVFWNIKHYFDCRDAQPRTQGPPADRTRPSQI